MTGPGAPLERADWAVPAGLALLAVAEIFTTEVPRVASIVTVVLSCGLLVWRRHQALVLATLSGVVLLLSAHVGVPDEELSVPLLILFTACFSLGRHVSSWWGAAGVAVLNLVLHWSYGFTVPPLVDWLWAGTLTFGPYVLGRVVLRHARASERLADRARQLVAEQRLVAERAVAEERRRIARELHDVIAHSLSVMVVQAGAAREVLDTDRATVSSALDEIQRAGRSALGETGRLLGLLREDGDTDLPPQPTAADLPCLVEEFRGSGLDVTLDLGGPTDALPVGIDLSVYRIVEEGLTNALKHGGGAAVVRYRRHLDSVEVELTSTAGAGPAHSIGHGHGLVGMRERVAVFGGTLVAEPMSGGGFHLSARLPIEVTP